MEIQIKSQRIYNALDFVNKNISSDTQRLIMGMTAIATQPLIDLKNKKIDEETRWTSVMRTTAKIIVGTTVGVLVRRSAIKFVRANKYFWEKEGLYSFRDKTFWKNIDVSNKDHRAINGYANTMGTVIGTSVGLITNFVIDAPLTKLFTNYLNNNLKPVCMEKFGKDRKAEGQNGQIV